MTFVAKDLAPDHLAYQSGGFSELEHESRRHIGLAQRGSASGATGGDDERAGSDGRLTG
jgi:hypothetical protein